MRDTLFRRLTSWCCLLPGLLVIAAAGYAQPSGLYRVELLVFAYPAGGAAEQWDALPTLAYPASTQFLLDSQDTGRAEVVAEQAAPVDASSSASPVAFGPSPAYVLLPATARELNTGAASLRGSGRYRILFHEAWMQPLPERSAAVPIVLDHSGDGGAWPELQGTITLFQAGEIVLETNLWLNTQGDYLPGTWRMPAPPRGPARPAGVLKAPADALPAEFSTEVSGQSMETGAADYPYRHAVLLQQTRRMRGSELYYIDHPLLGVLVKVSPLDAAPAVGTAGDASAPQPGAAR